MSFDQYNQENIDRYLRGELSRKELSRFEYELESDPILKKEVEEQKKLINVISAYYREKDIRSNLNKAHKEIDVRQVKREIYEPFILKKPKKFAKFAATIGMAATIAIVAMFGTLYFLGWFDYDKQMEPYSELKKDLDKISNNQKSIWSALKSEKKVTRYSGTCFSISNNGYLITNYHLVRNVDSVIISNKLDSVLSYNAAVVYTDRIHDLAILKIKDSNFVDFKNIPISFIEFGSDLGEYVYTLGYSKNDIVFGEGAISSLTGYNGDSSSYQISIPANPGNSGGPLIDSKGNLIGVISGKHSQKANATFAIKSNYITSIIDSIEQDSLFEKPIIPSANSLKWTSKTEQIKKMKPFIFQLKVYK